MRFSKAWLFWLILQIPLVSTFGQSNPIDLYTFNLKYHYGFVMMHSRNMAHLANQRPWGAEADIYRATTGKKDWELEHNYPIVGYAFLYFSMDKDKPLGDSYSLVIYYGKEYFKTRKGAFSFRIGAGPAYIERRFDKYSNYKNNLISNRINFALYGRLNYTYWITDHWNVNLGIGLTHHSNGSIQVPNLGVNIPAAFIGVGYRPGIPEKMSRPSLSEFKRKTEFHLSLAGGKKEVFPIEGPSYFISNFSGFITRRVNYKSGLNIGTDFMFDGSNKVILDSSGNKKNIKYFKWAITAGHEFYIGKVSLLTQLGFYVYDPLKKDKSLYQRIGLKYYFKENIFGVLALKTHFGAADYVEWGAGVKF